MSKIYAILFANILFCSICLHSEIITVSYQLAGGEVNNVDVSGKEVVITLDILDGTTFNNGSVDLFNRVNKIQIDVDQFTLIDDSFSFGRVRATSILAINLVPFSGNFSDQIDFDPSFQLLFPEDTGNREIGEAINGESITDFFNRFGNTYTTDSNSNTILSSGIFEQGGAITQNFSIDSGTVVTVTGNAVPEPRAYLLLLVIGMCTLVKLYGTKK